VSFVLLFNTKFQGFFGVPVTPQNSLLGAFGAFLTIVGVAFAIWARLTLGRNWSGAMGTVKEDHELIRSGPYDLTRHPIYTGFFCAQIGTALTIGILASYIGVVVILIAFLIRIHLEEETMNKEFPAAYLAYTKNVKTLIPFVW
jgi:protein-S-isoprenylcysteine O-methyltransferase Ste14